MRNVTLTIHFCDISQSFVSATKYENTSITTRELEITGGLKFGNCKFQDSHFTVTAAKEKK
jgi:hypothetical protein